MADRTMNDSTPNQTMRSEQAKAEVSGNSDRQREQGGMDKNREKSAIGGQSKGEEMSQDKSRESDKNRSETASRF